MDQKADVNPGSSPQEIERDIELTRERMTGTVDEIQERLSTDHWKAEMRERLDRLQHSHAVERMREAANRYGSTAKDAGNVLWDAIRSNPVPLALIGAGIAWIAYTSFSKGGDTMSESSSMKEKAGEMAGQAKEKLGQLSGKSSEYAGRVSETAGRFGSSARGRARAATGRVNRMVDENPIGIALTALGVGALLGFILPESRRERAMMGSASETLLTRAKETAQRTFQKAQDAAGQAVHNVTEEIRKTAA